MTVTTASPRQIAANRLNAAKSTGPASAAGGARSSFNALHHGLFAKDVVLPGEDRAAYDELFASLCADLSPVGPMEQGMVKRAADIWWRLGRTAAIEAGLLSPDWSGDPRAEHKRTGGGPLVDGFRIAMDEAETLDRLGRYEARLERALARTLGLFTRMRDSRVRGAETQRDLNQQKKPPVEK